MIRSLCRSGWWFDHGCRALKNRTSKPQAVEKVRWRLKQPADISFRLAILSSVLRPTFCDIDSLEPRGEVQNRTKGMNHWKNGRMLFGLMKEMWIRSELSLIGKSGARPRRISGQCYKSCWHGMRRQLLARDQQIGGDGRKHLVNNPKTKWKLSEIMMRTFITSRFLLMARLWFRVSYLGRSGRRRWYAAPSSPGKRMSWRRVKIWKESISFQINLFSGSKLCWEDLFSALL